MRRQLDVRSVCRCLVCLAILLSQQRIQAEQHWAFQPIRQPEVPVVKDSGWIRTPVDAFVLAKLDMARLAHSPRADRRTLIRRASYALTGLPPSPCAVSDFVNDPDPNAFEHLVDKLLDSTHYGEHWARRWLDVARYSDTKGYVYAREERFWVHAWAYRDWVVRSLNADMPYDRFLLLQLAADQVEDRAEADLAAMGFLTVGRRFLGVNHDIIDDRIDVVCRGAMGLTVACARCHDHKYDPIAAADYYSLYGVFDSCAERLVRLTESAPVDEAFEAELQRRQHELRVQMAAARKETSDRVRQRVANYLRAQTELHKYPPQAFGQILQKTDMLPPFVRRWENYLREADRRRDPVFAAWHAYAEIPAESFARRAAAVTRRLQDSAHNTINPIVAQAFVEPPATFGEVTERYAAIFAEINARWNSALDLAKKHQTEQPVELPEPAAEALRRVLYGPGAPCEVPAESIVDTESFFDTTTCESLWKLQGEVDRWIVNSNAQAPFALTLVDRLRPKHPRIFRRGNPVNKGDEVPRQLLPVLSGAEPVPFQHGSGRLELAKAIVDPGNPLTARVIVNRVWAHHFGGGLVTTPSDFGTRADPPSHPKLLDWLAARFVSDGWSLKKLHRWIMLSATYRQTSTGPEDSAARALASRIDPDNRLLWRMSQRRLTFEEFRDSMLFVAGDLDDRPGGKPAELFKKPFPQRRSLYGLVDRQFLPTALRTFDFANPDLHIPQRSETTIPQQALFFMNHPLVLERARSLAKICQTMESPDEAIRALFQRVYQRDPTDVECVESLDLVHAAARTEETRPPPTAADWQYGYGAFDEESQRVNGFFQLPHFTGEAWQGGSDLPDARLGWVHLTAAGGHPGNDRQHAAIRRWTAPRPAKISIRSQLIHEAAPGDGIRAFIVSSRAGLLDSTKIHQQTVRLNVDALDVAAGETIDFVVDIGDVLNSDQYLWDATVREMSETERAVAWNSQADFPRDTINRLTGWEQLTQLLLCTNEFLFVD